MAKLTPSVRNSLPGKVFGLPGKRAYPMPDATHAINAKARAAQQYDAGKLTTGQKGQIDAKANRVLRALKGG